jgi:hypothetical protein
MGRLSERAEAGRYHPSRLYGDELNDPGRLSLGQQVDLEIKMVLALCDPILVTSVVVARDWRATRIKCSIFG